MQLAKRWFEEFRIRVNELHNVYWYDMLSRQVDMDTTLNTIVKCIRQQRHANGNDVDGLKIKVIYQPIIFH